MRIKSISLGTCIAAALICVGMTGCNHGGASEAEGGISTPIHSNGNGIDNAVILASTIPSQVACGTEFEVEITVRNNGSTTWTRANGYKLGAVDDSDPFHSAPRVWLEAGTSVAPGGTHVFSVQLSAPQHAGSYTTDWRMVHEGMRWFGASLSTQVVVNCNQVLDDAEIVSAMVPSRLSCGETSIAQITVRNTGTETWSRASGYKFGTVDDDDPLHDRPRVWLAEGISVPPGGTHVFEITVVAPLQAGRYTTDWRMVHEGVQWFGATALSEVVVECNHSGDQAQIVSTRLPTQLACGRSFVAQVSIRNSGSTTWTRADGYKLGTVDDNDPLHQRPRVWLEASVSVPPGGTHNFEMTLVAPQQAGRYTTDWRMVREGVNWFGATAISEVVVECTQAVARTGQVRLAGNSLRDDTGIFSGLGATMMWAAWAYRHDRPRLEADLAFLSTNGFDYIRALGVVGDVNRADYWDGREIDRNWPDYNAVIAGLTDLAYDQYGLRIEWTLIGDGQVSVPAERDRYELVDRFLAMSVGREHKIMHFEIANEAWQNGFDGSAGLTQLRAITRYMNDRTSILVAASAPNGHECSDAQSIYAGGVADIATIHFDRRNNLTDGAWRPVRQPWEHQYCTDVPVGSNNEPIGPGASVSTESDSVRLVSAAIATYVSGLPMYVFHSNAGVRGNTNIRDAAGANAFVHLRNIVPADLPSWSQKNAHWSDSPFLVYAGDERGQLQADHMWPDLHNPSSGVVRAYGAVSGNEFFVFPMGILGRVIMEPRRDVEFDVINIMTGVNIATRTLNAGQRFELSGADALILRGRYR